MGKFMKEVQEHQKTSGGRSSKIDEIREALGDDDFKDFVEALKDLKISAPTIAAVLKKRGVEVAANTILNHRNKIRS